MDANDSLNHSPPHSPCAPAPPAPTEGGTDPRGFSPALPVGPCVGVRRTLLREVGPPVVE